MATYVAFSCLPHAAASAAKQPSPRPLAASAIPAARSFVLHQRRHAFIQRRQQPVRAEGDDARQFTATEEDEELPPWLRREKMQKMADAEGGLPFGLYLLASSLVAIATVGSIFELINQNPIFGVVPPDSPIYLPILGTFAVTGFPTTGWLFLKGVNAANQLSERMDKIDGGR